MTTSDRVGFSTGTHRACPPEETWARVQPLLGRVGITRVGDITWLDDLGIPTWQAVRPASRTLTVSQGKGVSDVAAKVSAVMESIEMWHAERIPADLRATTTEASPGYDVRRLPLAPGSLLHDELRLDWVAGVELGTGKQSWLPHQLLELDNTPCDDYRPPLFMPSSTGLASGNTWDEATLHALLEVVERESLCAAGDAACPVRLAEVTDPVCRRLLERLATAGAHVTAHDMTVTERVACYSVALRSPEVGVTFEGSGAHLDPSVALARALTEAAQARAAVISGAREDIDPAVYRVLGAQLPPLSGLPPVVGDTVPPRRAAAVGTSIAAALRVVVQEARRLLGAEPVCVRLDRGLDLPVVRVVVPGARRDESFTHRRPDASMVGR